MKLNLSIAALLAAAVLGTSSELYGHDYKPVILPAELGGIVHKYDFDARR